MAGASILLFFLLYGRYSFSPFIVPLTEEFAVPRGVISSIFSLAMVLYAIASPLAGYLAGSFGYFKVMGVGAVVCFGGVALAGLAGDVWQLYLLYGLLFGAGSAVLYSLPVAMVRQGFPVGSGLALGITTAVGGVGITAGPVIAAYLIDMVGWRGAFTAIGALGLTFSLLGGLILARGLPDSMVRVTTIPGDLGVAKKQAAAVLRQRDFWFFTLSYGLYGFGQLMILVHLVAYGTDRGLEPTLAALIAGFVGLVGLGSKPLLGWFCDRFGRVAIMTFCFFIQAGAVVLLLAADTAGLLWIFAFIFGFVQGAIIAQFPGLLGDAYRGVELGTLVGIITSAYGLAGSAGSSLAGFLFDSTGSYHTPFILALVMFVVGAVFLVVGNRMNIVSTARTRTGDTAIQVSQKGAS